MLLYYKLYNYVIFMINRIKEQKLYNVIQMNSPEQKVALFLFPNIKIIYVYNDVCDIVSFTTGNITTNSGKESFENACDERGSIKYTLSSQNKAKQDKQTNKNPRLFCLMTALVSLLCLVIFFIGFPQMVNKLHEESFFVFKLFASPKYYTQLS